MKSVCAIYHTCAFFTSHRLFRSSIAASVFLTEARFSAASFITSLSLSCPSAMDDALIAGAGGARAKEGGGADTSAHVLMH